MYLKTFQLVMKFHGHGKDFCALVTTIIFGT